MSLIAPLIGLLGGLKLGYHLYCFARSARDFASYGYWVYTMGGKTYKFFFPPPKHFDLDDFTFLDDLEKSQYHYLNLDPGTSLPDSHPRSDLPSDTP